MDDKQFVLHIILLGMEILSLDLYGSISDTNPWTSELLSFKKIQNHFGYQFSGVLLNLYPYNDEIQLPGTEIEKTDMENIR